MITENAALALGISRFESVLRRRIEAALRAGHGTGFTDFFILAELSAVQGRRLRGSDLATRLSLSPSGVSRAVAPLERLRLITREADRRDARAGYVVLSAAGEEYVAKAMPTVERVVSEAVSGTITRSDRLALLGLFERFAY